MNIDGYIDNKIKEINQQRLIEAKWTQEVLDHQQKLKSKFNNTFDELFIEQIKKLIKVLDQNKEFEDLISINSNREQSSIIVGNQYLEVKIYLNFETKNIEITHNSYSGHVVYDLTQSGTDKAKKDFIDEIIEQFQYPAGSKEKNLRNIKRYKKKFGIRQFKDEDYDVEF